MAKINVLKPFVLSIPAAPHKRLPTEIHFKVGEQEVPDEIANHPYILDCADGHVESYAQAVVRTTEAAKKAEQAKLDADRANKNAELALRRRENAARVGQAGSLAAADELNTPIGGRPIDLTSEAVRRELDTPLDQLRSPAAPPVQASGVSGEYTDLVPGPLPSPAPAGGDLRQAAAPVAIPVTEKKAAKR